jgi:putative membrane protein
LGELREVLAMRLHFVRFGLYSAGFRWGAFLFFVLLLILIVALIAFAYQAAARRGPWHHHNRDQVVDQPQVILRERLARGEIDEEEFQRKSELLRRSTNP